MSKPEIKQHDTWRFKHDQYDRLYILALTKTGYIVYVRQPFKEMVQGKCRERWLRSFFEPDPSHTLCFKEANFD